ncbi:MAG TPA: asparagine synthase (glutamine-hydrolyzing), partial [Pyrinomonadaceae bacterium]
MCSISGILTISDHESAKGQLKRAVTRMNAALRHRGPDDSGIFESDSNSSVSVCIGNTRLAIIDTSSAGHQPMVDSETGICLSYNGETYNFQQLRQEIGTEFGPWSSTTDTEVVLRTYRKWGIAGLRRLRGMFALAIWNPNSCELILARDPFGIKPLYYCQSQHTLIFASEIRAMIASGLVGRVLSGEGVASYLSYGSTQAPVTIVKDVKSTMPGECVVFRPLEKTWQSESVLIKPPAVTTHRFETRAHAAEQLRAELERSVHAHLVSDVPLGVFLSGGMDSSALVALMSRTTKDQVDTFSVVFDDDNLNEARHSRLIADRFRTNHREILLNEHSLLCELPNALRSFDQPSMDGVNAYVVSKAVKEAQVTVALSGLGGDELFGGYPSFRRAIKLNSTPRSAKRFVKALSTASRFATNGSVRHNKFWQLAASQGTAHDVYRITRQLFNPITVEQLVGCLHRSDTNGFHASSDPINDISRLELEGYMANTLLRDTDAMSMAHSLEVRVPFVDINVVQFALSLPGELKLNGGSRHLPKPLLAAALSDLLSPECLARRKMGFTLPFERWMQSRLQNELSNVLRDGNGLKRIGLNGLVVS